MFRSTSRSSNPKKSYKLGIAGVANLFIRLKRLENRASKGQNHTVISSGEPKTHPGIAEGAKEEPQVAVEFIDNYVCAGGVNVATLVRATRSALLEHVDDLGANSLVEEKWECDISGPKSHNGTYKVQIRYLANATRSSVRDPHKPVALDQARSIPGLMTILTRNDL